MEQASVMEIVQDIDLAESGVPSLIMRDLAEFSSLAFLAGFHTQYAPVSSAESVVPTPSTRKQVTYVALSKKTMPTLVELYMRFKHHADVYEDGTLEAVLSVSGTPHRCGCRKCPSSWRRRTGFLSSSSMTVRHLPSLARIYHSGRPQRRVPCVS
jgi:hypothetical protein